MLAMGGLQIKLAAGATLDLQGGLMTNKVNYMVNGIAEDGVTPFSVPAELSLDKLLLMGNVTILF